MNPPIVGGGEGNHKENEKDKSIGRNQWGKASKVVEAAYGSFRSSARHHP